MVKSTVRFSESTVEEIESLVEEGVFESKSEFYRFASEYILEQLSDGYEPSTVDFQDIKADVFPNEQLIEPAEGPQSGLPFFESVATVRRFVLRGKVQDAEDFIDHHYTTSSRDALLLEELLECYRKQYSASRPSTE
ncbi:ribbon-helix-helix domain-containing protein [Haloarchaeobius sp. DFWS5]|uniref:ribbon-helix-helix domain-containing protein n=1 Tax=Haloarchaeobius sp. DFWS5 TaxID=3446114 RepID=UPI003EB7FF65